MPSATRRVAGRRASMNGFPNRVWEQEIKMKRVTTLILIIAVVLFLVPWGIYYHSLSLVGKMPVSPIVVMSDEDLIKIWKKNEKEAVLSKIDEVTPYWIYHWLIMAIANDDFSYNEIPNPDEKMSIMASTVAITQGWKLFW